MSEPNWRKSTRSKKFDCVEVAISPQFTAIRDSKDPDGGQLVVPGEQWQTFLAHLRQEEH